MADEEEEYEVPSAIKKKEVELSRGVVLLPPEKMKKMEEERKREEEIEKEAEAKRKVEEKLFAREEKKVVPVVRPSGVALGPSVSSVIAMLAIIIAIAAIGLSYITLNSYNKIRTELKGIIVDLQAFKEGNITIDSKLTVEHVIQEDLPLRDILSQSTIPVSTVLEVEGDVKMYNPVTRTYESGPYRGNITVRGNINVDPSGIDPSRKLRLNYTVPGTGEMSIKVPGNRLWTSDLDDVISRLERIVG
ncbi:MAG: hypothetical protein QW112_03015 [Candidatus Micrarchaeia archaeon]